MPELLAVATGDDQVTEHADWVELQASFNADGSVSREDLARAINRVGQRTDDTARDLADLAFEELADREATLSCMQPLALQYPFRLTSRSQVLQWVPRRSARAIHGIAYMFLLGVTRHSMDARRRVHDGIDPTYVFEQLCSEVLLHFWGGPNDRCGTVVIGTSGRKNGHRKFPASIDSLCGSMKEGGGWKADARSPKGGDGGLDLAVWRRFADGRAGGLVGFAQCKTGIHWRRDLGKLSPRAFCSNYMKAPLLLDPQALYMIPCRVSQDRWEHDTRNASAILFDRCRLVEYGDLISRKTFAEAKTWLAGALRDQGVGT